MIPQMRITYDDRLVVGWKSYRLIERSKTGYSFEETDGQGRTIFYGADELRELLKRHDVLLELGYLRAETQRIQRQSNVDLVGALDEKIRSVVLWRHAYCDVFLQYHARGEVKKCERSIAGFRPMLEQHVNAQAQAAQSAWKLPRAGKNRLYRDPPCARTLLAWVRRYESAGNSPLALIPGTHRSGNRKDRFCLESLRFIGEALQVYLTRQRLSKRQVARHCTELFRRANEARSIAGLPLLTVPSKRKIERALGKLDPYSTYAHRHGIDAANRKFMLYEDGIKASYPMERIEIDEWRVDLITILAERGALDHLTPDELALLPRGRRWLYLAIDCASRCVLGMRLAETPNSDDAVALLADVTRDKSQLARAAGCQSHWHHHGGLSTVATDLGAAFVDDSFRAAIFDAQGTPETPTGGLPQLRARVERIFGTFGTSLLPHLAGRTFSNPQERGDYPSEAMASISDDVLMQMLILYVVDVYHNQPHRGLAGETPNNCWKRLAADMGVTPDVPEITRRRAFGRRLVRTVSGKGVRVFGIDYNCSALQQFHLHSHETDVELRIDLTNLGWIVVCVHDKWHAAHAIQKCFEGVNFDDWEAAARDIRLKHRAEAHLAERSVARAIIKIIELNRQSEARFGTELKALTPAGLGRGKEDLFLGLSIEPEDDDGFDLPQETDLFGHVIPGVDAEDAFHKTGQSNDETEKSTKKRWRLDDE